MRLILVAIMTILLGLTGVAAQTVPPITVYLYEPVLGELFRVDETGNAAAYSLGVENPRFTQVSGIAVNDAGTQAVFCMVNYRPEDGGTPQATFVVRDILTESNLLTVNLGDAESCETGKYNPDQSQITLAHVVYSTFMPEQQLDPNRASWRLLVLDVATGEIVHTLEGNQPNAPTIAMGDMNVQQILARTVAFEEDRVLFQAFPYVPTEAFVDQAFAWDLNTDELQPFPNLGTFMVDYLPETNGLVFGAQSDNVPLPQAFGIGPVYNAIRYQEGIGGEPQTLFESSEENIGRVSFAFNGERVLAMLNSAGEQMDMQSRWLFMDRDGTITGEFDAPEMVRGVTDGADGLVVLHEEQVPQSFPTTLLSYYDGETLTEFWRYDFPADQESWSGFFLVWVSG